MGIACFAKQLLKCHLLGNITKLKVRTFITPSCIFWRYYRRIHTTNSLMIEKILTPDQLFCRTSLQNYLRTLKAEYTDCLQCVNAGHVQMDNDEMRTKRARLTVLAPLVQCITELDSKHRDLQETEELLNGENKQPIN